MPQGVLDERAADPEHLLAVAERHHLVRHGDRDDVPAPSATGAELGRQSRDRLREVDRLGRGADLIRVQPRQIEQVAGEPRQTIHLTPSALEEVPPRGLVEILVGEQLEEPPDREQGRTELVRRVGDELPPGAVELRELHPHAVETPGQLGHLVLPVVDHRGAEVPSRDVIGRDLESPDPPYELERGQSADEPRRRQGHAAEEEQIPADDVDRRQPVGERRRDEENVIRADRPCDLGELAAVALRAPLAGAFARAAASATSLLTRSVAVSDERESATGTRVVR